ncbi:hypothetical protein C8J31_1374 [Rhizobium sp. PP-CC-2G-626]|nr:hypothetical protein C8J31_1374 [Rhizobium sp. PP-CC-2G-626]
MKTVMEQLRADMMTKGAFTRHERRQIRTLTKANEAQREYVRAALPAKHLARRWMADCGDVDCHGNINYCGVPLCPRCYLRERGVQTGKAIKKIFGGAENEDLAFATILLPPQLDFSGMTDLVETEKRRLRTFIDRQRKADSRWDDFQLLGWWEIDRMNFGDFDSCGRNTRIALEALGFPLMEAPDKTIWRPHLHAIIRRGKLTTEEITHALRKETHRAKYQVVIEPFRANRSVGDNIQNIVRYCLKFRIECDYKRPNAQDFIEADEADQAERTARSWWPADDVRDYVDWLCVKRSGFQSLRVVIGQAKSKDVVSGQVDTSLDMAVSEELEDGGVSSNSISNRSLSLGGLRAKRDQVGLLNVDGVAVGIDIRCLSTTTDVVFGVVEGSVYNNIVKDTNWTGLDEDRMHPPMDGASMPGNGDTHGQTSRYAGNIISLAERLRSIADVKRASGPQ